MREEGDLWQTTPVWTSPTSHTCIENNYFKTMGGKTELAHAYVRKMSTLRIECGNEIILKFIFNKVLDNFVNFTH